MTPGTVTTRWQDFATVRPELAAAGEFLFRAFTVGYLATIRGDGAPRVHPVTVTVHDGGLYICTIAATRKSADLRRDGRYALHAFPRFPTETGWSDEEFMVGGRAVEITDATRRSVVLAVHNDTVADADPLWELEIDRAFHKSREDGQVRTTSYRRGLRP